ncbi:MAG: YkgJ family cysteine cluster protein [Gammaproteobacteria bacterium]|jgi:hypothetical protein
MAEVTKTRLVDCEEGRRMGCATFCCRMMVRLQPDEMEKGDGKTPPKGFVDKDPEGFCIHIDKETGYCNNWKKRPKVCREYECNSDFLLQVVIRNGFSNIAELARQAQSTIIPKETYIYVPTIEVTNTDKNAE